MIRKSIIVVAVAALFCIASSAQATLLAEWTFQVSVPATAGPHAAEGGLNAGVGSPAIGLHASGATVYSSPAGNGSSNSFSSNTWAVGDYYQFCTSTAGYNTIVVSWDQTGSNTGPRDFELRSSADGYASNLLSYVVLFNGAPNASWSAGSTPAQQAPYKFSVAVPALDNLASACFRLRDASTTSINGTTVAAGGTDRVDNAQFNGELIPEPGTLALLGIGAFGLIRRRR